MVFGIVFQLLKRGKFSTFAEFRIIAPRLPWSICDAGDDGVLLQCGTDTDRRCELFSSSDLTALTHRRRLEHDEGLQLSAGDRWNSVHVCTVVVTPSIDTSTSVTFCRYSAALSVMIPFSCGTRHGLGGLSPCTMSLSRRHSFRHRRQPDTTRSALCRQHVVSANEMSYVHGRACILLLWPTRMERSAFNPP